MVMVCNLVTLLAALALGVILGRIWEMRGRTRPVSGYPPRAFGNLERELRTGARVLILKD